MLIATPNASWREWLKENLGGRDLLLLDPADANHGPAGRLCLIRGDRVVAWRFYGSLDPQRAPHVLIAAATAMATEDAVVQLFSYSPTPLLRHLAILLAQLLRPQEILMEAGGEIDQEGWPVGPQDLELPPAFPAMVQAAQRKANWIGLMEACEPHELDLDKVSFEGSRLGSGIRLRDPFLVRDLPEALYAEQTGSTLFVVAQGDIEEARMSRALDHYHCSRAVIAHTEWYENLLCSFARQDGEDFGYGIVERIDFRRGVVCARTTAVPPAPVRILRLGSLQVGPSGEELGELKPWQV